MIFILTCGIFRVIIKITNDRKGDCYVRVFNGGAHGAFDPALAASALEPVAGSFPVHGRESMRSQNDRDGDCYDFVWYGRSNR